MHTQQRQNGNLYEKALFRFGGADSSVDGRYGELSKCCRNRGRNCHERNSLSDIFKYRLLKRKSTSSQQTAIYK